jgi:hypothetical protein
VKGVEERHVFVDKKIKERLRNNAILTKIGFHGSLFFE